jgi:prepilin-type N-terminal cleavage/methylation domain-containing protein/prepilin-type processing-associated H-X9-DG protein
MKTKPQAFTLIELLTVIAVIGVLAAILIPAVSKVRHRAQTTEAISNLRQIGAAALLYANDHQGKVPGLGNDTTTNGMGAAGALFPYLESRTMDGFPTWEELKRTYLAIRDPRMPDEILRDGWNWLGFNGLFADYPQAVSGGPQPDKDERRLLNFEKPNQVIYAASGNGNLKVDQASNPAQLPVPKSPRQGFYFCHDGAVPVAFLDGHVEMLGFPINPAFLDPNYKAQD